MGEFLDEELDGENLFNRFQQSIPRKIIDAATDPLQSASEYMIHRITGKPDALDPHFDNLKKPLEKEITFSDTFGTLTAINNHLVGEYGVPDQLLKQQEYDWQKVKGILQDFLVLYLL